MSKKTDNKNIGIKLDIRRYMLDKYHGSGEGIRVFDCCQGGGHLWNSLKAEYQVDSYWGVDIKPKRGRLKVDSVRILQSGLKHENVIDIDTYGMPWDHYKCFTENLTGEATVFLTIGSVGTMSAPKIVSEAIGFDKLSPPQKLCSKAGRTIGLDYCLHYLKPEDVTLVESVKLSLLSSSGLMEYVGVRLKKSKPE